MWCKHPTRWQNGGSCIKTTEKGDTFTPWRPCVPSGHTHGCCNQTHCHTYGKEENELVPFKNYTSKVSKNQTLCPSSEVVNGKTTISKWQAPKSRWQRNFSQVRDIHQAGYYKNKPTRSGCICIKGVCSVIQDMRAVAYTTLLLMVIIGKQDLGMLWLSAQTFQRVV